MAYQDPLLSNEEEEEEDDDSKEKCIKMVVVPVIGQYLLIMVLTVAIGLICWHIRIRSGMEVLYSGVQALHYMFFWEALAFVAAIIAVVNAVVHSFQHWRHSSAGRDIHICCQVIIWVVPVYATCSAVAFAAEVSETRFSVLYNALREAYEAIVLIFFMLFVAEYMGGVDALAQSVAGEEIVIGKILPHKVVKRLRGFTICGKEVLDIRPFPFKRAPGSEFIYCSFAGILQYALVIFGILVAHFTIWAVYTRLGEEKTEMVEHVEEAMKVVKLASNGWALFNLLVLYEYLIEAEHTKAKMEKINPHSKFWCIKLIVMFSLWQENIFEFCAKQGLLPTMLGWNVVWRSDSLEEQTILADGAVNFFVCLEMVLFAQWHRFAYPYDEYLMDHAEEDTEEKRGLGAFRRDLINLRDKAKQSRQDIRFLRNDHMGDSDDLKRAFESFDLDENGEVQLAQLQFLLTESTMMSTNDTRNLLQAVDRNGNGRLSWLEFKAACETTQLSNRLSNNSV